MYPFKLELLWYISFSKTVTMSRIYKGQKAGGRGEETELEWEKFPATGLAKTYNTDYQGMNQI